MTVLKRGEVIRNMSLTNLENPKYDIKYVANYLRKSRAESLEDLEKHRMVLNELCKKRGYKYIEFLEIGTSDSLELRPKMSKLLKEIEDDTYDAVCVVDYDRLSRGDMGDQDRIAKTLSLKVSWRGANIR
jgi:DNA invertase Pin-like site-specific DNA recombinase